MKAGLLAGRGGGVEPTLPVLADLEVWYDAADAATISASGGNVSTWNDKSGNGRHLTGVSNPRTGDATINGKNCISVTGTSYLNRNSTNACQTHVTCFVVFRKTGSNHTFETHPIVLNGSNVGLPFDAWSHASSGNHIFIGSTSVSGFTDIRAQTTPCLLRSVLQQNAISAGTHTVSQHLNGVSVHSGNVTSSWNHSGQNIHVGRRSDAGTMFRGDVAEIAIYNSILSGPEIASVEAYLAGKWGITI